MTNAKIVVSLPSCDWWATTKMAVIGLHQICNAAAFLPMYVGQWHVMLLGKRGSYSILKKLLSIGETTWRLRILWGQGELFFADEVGRAAQFMPNRIGPNWPRRALHAGFQVRIAQVARNPHTFS